MNNSYKIHPCHDKLTQEYKYNAITTLRLLLPIRITISVPEHYRLFRIPPHFNNDM